MTSEYWKNPINNYIWPSKEDPIVTSQHDGVHCLFFDPAINTTIIAYRQNLQMLCEWINTGVKEHGIDNFVDDNRNWYSMTNVVKLNIWANDIQKQGIVKPMLLYYNGGDKYGINNGESRLRACSVMSGGLGPRAFISTSTQYRDKFSHLEEVTSFDQFANLCNAVEGQEFMIKFTDSQAPYGLEWYEYNSFLTSFITPGQNDAVSALRKYINKHPDVVFDREWFTILIDWEKYGLPTPTARLINDRIEYTLPL